MATGAVSPHRLRPPTHLAMNDQAGWQTEPGGRGASVRRHSRNAVQDTAMSDHKCRN
jgi:hypothetical protein